MKKKITLVLFALVIMLTLCIIASAADNTEWTLSEDGQTLMVGADTYELYNGYLYPTDKFLPEEAYVYANMLDYYYYLKRNYENDGIMILSSGSSSGIEYVYVNNEGRAILNKYLNGNYSSYKICQGRFLADTTSGWVASLNGGYIVTIDVRDLQNCEKYEVLGYDITETIAHTVGTIYADGTSYYYVNYDKLSNNYFDANGNFSYRQGTVKAYTLKASQASDLEEYIDNMQYIKTIYEEDESFGEIGKGFATVYFIIITAIFGFIIPLVPVVIGTIRIITGKSRNPKRWYLLFVGCGIWIILAICILLTLII